MRVFLRHVRTGYFYNTNFEWVSSEIDARHLPNIERALRLIIRDKLEGMSLVIRYDESGSEQVFDLSDDHPVVLPNPAGGPLPQASE